MALLAVSTILTSTSAAAADYPQPQPQMKTENLLERIINSDQAAIVASPAISLKFERIQVTSSPAPKPEPKPEAVEAEKTKTETPTDVVTPPQPNVPAKTSLSSVQSDSTPAAAPVASTPPKAVAVSPGSAQAEAASQMQAYGWGADQLACLIPLWQKESGWNLSAANPSSGAYGIPQSLPGNKMASAGADWQTNPATQIKWGLGYIAERYKTPCGAWSHSVAVGWY